jgi:hypothetical protein
MATSTYTTLGIVEESTYGTTPAAALQLMNIRNLTMGRNKTTGMPNVYTGDRRTFPSEVLQKDGSFTFEAPLQYENTLHPWEGLAGSSRSSAVDLSGITISATGGVVSDSANGLGPVDNGDYVFIAGAGVAPNPVAGDWYGPVTASVAGSFAVPTTQLQNFTAGSAVTIKTRRLKDGTTPKSFSGEWHITSLTNQFQNEKGIKFSQVVVTWTQGQFATEQWTGAGRFPAAASATIGTGAELAAPTSGFMTAVGGWGKLFIARASTGLGITSVTPLIVSSLTLTIQQAIADTVALGDVGPTVKDEGSYEGSQVQITARFDDAARTALSDPIQSHETMALGWGTVDTQGNKEFYSLPACKPSGDVTFGDANTVVNIPVTFSIHDAAKDASSAYLTALFGYQWAKYYVPAT